MTQYLFTGEHFDEDLQKVFLRKRYLNTEGRFCSSDDFDGILRMPSSLNRYQYVTNSPTNNVDPSGRFLEGLKAFLGMALEGLEYARFGMLVHEQVGLHFESTVPGGVSNSTIGTLLRIGTGKRLDDALRPDLSNTLTGEIYEIKPGRNRAAGIFAAETQLFAYIEVLNTLQAFSPEMPRNWHPGESYTPPFSVFAMNQFVRVERAAPGVILYYPNTLVDVASIGLAMASRIISRDMMMKSRQLLSDTATAFQTAALGAI